MSPPYTEMKVGLWAIVISNKAFWRKVVLNISDNSTVVAYLSKQGGTKFPDMCLLAWDFQWCKERNVLLKFAHIAGKKNIVLADRLSRGRTIRATEWALPQTVVGHIFQVWYRLHIPQRRTGSPQCSILQFPIQLWKEWILHLLRGDDCIRVPPPNWSPQNAQKVTCGTLASPGMVPSASNC